MEEDWELRQIRLKKMGEMLTREERGAGHEAKVHEISDDEFDRIVQEKEYVLVDFWAPWCPPCLMIAPIVEELARQYPQVFFAKINVDQHQRVATRYGIMSIPTLLLFKRGKLVDQQIGAVPKSRLEEKIRKLLG